MRDWIDELKAEVPQLWAEAYHYYSAGKTLFLPPELESEANKRQAEYTTAAGNDLLEEIEAFLNRPIPIVYFSWSQSKRLQWQKWAVDSSSFIEDEYRQIGTEPLTTVSPKMIKCELPNDTIRTSFRYSSQYINSLLEHISGWKRSEQEKVPGMHPDYCGTDGRAKRPWLRVDVPEPKIISPTLDFGETEGAPF